MKKRLIALAEWPQPVMMWETIPDISENVTWFDFKYINGRKIWGLNKPAVFSKDDLREIIIKYEKKTGKKLL